MMLKRIQLLAILPFLVLFAVGCNGPKVEEGAKVTFEYTGKFKSGDKKGEVFDSTDGKQPLTATIGTGQLLKAFEAKLTRMSNGASKTFTLKPEEAYGVKDPEKIVELSRDQRFKGVDLKEGSTIFAMNKGKDGKEVPTPLKVVSFTDDKVTVDYNHPLAGETLSFKVKVVGVENPAAEATEQEKPAKAPEETASKA